MLQPHGARQYNPPQMDPPHRRRSLPLALLLSLALHLTLLNLPVPKGEAVSRSPESIEVSLLPPDALPAPPAEPAAAEPRQMVSPPDVVNDRPPERTRFESDRDNTVLQETVRPGVPNPAAPAPRSKPAPPPRQATRDNATADRDEEHPPPRGERARARVPSLDDLFASTDELVRAQQAARERQDALDKAQAAAGGRRRVAIAVPPVTPEWALPGQRGTMDYLPDIQRGDVTLLNTKANTFSPFVRRVGERVFQHLVIRQRRLQLEQILSARSPVQMRVLLDQQGHLKSVRVEEQSGSATMDETLSEALHTAAFDNNPPPAAANAAGEYEFVFQAQLRAFQPGAGNLPSRIESRLSVGLL